MIKIKVNKIPFNDDAIAAAIGPIILLKKGEVNKGVVAHEEVHAKIFLYWLIPSAVLSLVAFYLGCIGLWTAVPLMFTGAAVRAALYNLVEKYRVWEEVKAYGKQASVNNYVFDKTRSLAKTILDNYTKDGYSMDELRELEERIINEQQNNN